MKKKYSASRARATKAHASTAPARHQRVFLAWCRDLVGEDAPTLLRAINKRGDIQFRVMADGGLMLRLAQ